MFMDVNYGQAKKVRLNVVSPKIGAVVVALLVEWPLLTP